MDKIYYNANIRAMDEAGSIYSAIGIEGNRICFLGSDEDALGREAKERIDLAGMTIVPGLIDSHLHLLNYAFVKGSYRMASAASIGEIVEEGRRRIADGLEEGAWLYGRGWDQNRFTDEPRFLTKDDLDRISTEVPILFIRNCGHIAAVNTLGLEKVLASKGIDAYLSQIDTEQGLLTEASVKACYNVMSAPSVSRIKEFILGSLPDFAEHGITTVGSDNFLSLPGRDPYAIMQAFHELEEEGALTLRVQEQASFTNCDDLRVFLGKGHHTGEGSALYNIGPVKLFQDGSLGARTALMNEPYDGTDTCGTMVHPEEELQELVDVAYENGNGLLIHTIGDKASDMVMDAYEKAIQKYGKKEARLAINHLQLVSEDLFDRMKSYDILAFIQPVFVASDKAMVTGLVGEERAGRSYAWKTMKDKGLVLCGGSDAPVESFDVLENVEIALTRDRIGECTEGWHPWEKLSIDEAMRAFTIDNACGMGMETCIGSLEIGKLADFTVLGADPYGADPHEIHKIPVERTIVDGKEVYIHE